MQIISLVASTSGDLLGQILGQEEGQHQAGQVREKKSCEGRRICCLRARRVNVVSVSGQACEPTTLI